MNTWQPRPLLLASGSPRRKELLQQAGFNFRVAITHADEELPLALPVYEAAEFLAIRKGNAARALANSDEIILAADSVVILDNEILDKPQTHEEAVSHLTRLAGKTHDVITGICLIYQDLIWSDSARTAVRFAHLSEQEALWYIDHGHPFDKAGGYGIQEWIGLCKIDQIEGTYPNVLGLPVHLVYDALQQFPHWSKADQG